MHYAEACTDITEGPHGWAFAGSFPVAYCHSVGLHACIIIGMKLLEAKAHQHTLSLNVGIVSLNVSKCFTGECYG